MKLEDHTRKQGTNFINYEPRPITEEKEPNINIINRGGISAGVDVDNPCRCQVQFHKGKGVF